MPSNAYTILQNILSVFKGTPGNLQPPPRGMSNEETILYKIYKALILGSGSSPGTGVEEAPEDGTPYVRQDGGWVSETTSSGVEEAPEDGETYVRKDAGWESVDVPLAESVSYVTSDVALADSSGLDPAFRRILNNVSSSEITITVTGSDTIMGEVSQILYPDESFQLGLNGTDYRIL